LLSLFHVSTLPDGADINAVSPTSALYSTFHPADYNMIQSMTTSTSASTRYRSRTPGPGEESRRGMGAGTGAGLGSSSDCIYSLGESVNGLELYRCPSPPLNTTTTGANSGLGGNGGGAGAGAAVWTTGLKRYGGTDFDAYCLQQGLSRSNPFGSGQLLHLNSEYETLPRRTTVAPQIYGEFFVNLRHEANGFGFKLLGGSEEGTQVTIGQLAPGGAAERSTHMRAGDRLVSVNGTRVLGGSHAKALALLERAAEAHGEVTLGLWRPPPSLPASASTSTSGSRSTESSKTRCWPSNVAAPAGLRSVLLQRAPGEEGFGFVLANAPSKPDKSRRDGQVDTRSGDHFISRVVAGSASDRSRLLHVGDRLLSVNGVNVASLPREEVIRLVKASGPQLALTVLPCNVPITPSYEQMQFYNSQLYHHQQQQLHQQQRERAVFFHVTLFRSSRGFGFSIRGGHEFNQMPLTVLRVAEGGPAHLDGRLKVGDELLQINGFMTAGMSHRRAVEIIQAGGNMIRLGVRRSLLSSGEVKNLAAPSQLSPSPLSFASFGLLPPTLSPGPMAPQPLPVPPPPPPNLRTPQFFTPIPVHKSSIGSRPLLSSVKSPQRQRSLITYQSLPRLWQKHHDGTGTHSSSHHDLEAWASGDRGCYGTQLEAMPLISACVPEENQVKVISRLDQSASWDSNIYEVLLSAASSEKSVPFPIDGGSDSGLFCTVGGTINPAQLIYHPIISSSTSPKRMPSILRPGDVILEIGEYQLSGFTRLDAVRLCETLFHANSSGDRPRILLKLISPSALPTGSAQLHCFLSAQFQIGTPEFLLQEVTRNNIYQRVVPCRCFSKYGNVYRCLELYRSRDVFPILSTTREPRPEERDGVDYQFLGVERFLALEKSGQLLESGMYKGTDQSPNGFDTCNHYGTPRPDANATALHVEARTKDGGDGDHSASESNGERSATSPELTCAAEGSLGQQQQQQQQQQQRDLSSIALPNGWEVIDHPEYGLFYVDHIHQKTQYEPPTEADFEEAARFHAAKSSTSSITYTDNISNNGSNGKNHQKHQTSSSDTSDKSTDDAAQVRGPLITAVLVKGSKGFGFTIIGGSSPGQPGFLQVRGVSNHLSCIRFTPSSPRSSSLNPATPRVVFVLDGSIIRLHSQVKNVIPGGPAAQEGTLAVGNVLVSANGINVLGFSHDQIVTLFQSIPVGGTVTLTVSQGYSFVGAGAKKSQHQLTTVRSKPTVVERSVPFAPPDLCIRRLNTSPTISQLSGETEEEATSTAVSRSGAGAGAVVTAPVAVTKQTNGFGFTLADQVGGQRVKEVLEPTGLRVGDVILEVNGKWVKEASHLEVVQLLKTCPIGKTTNFLIQRGICHSPSYIFSNHFFLPLTLFGWDGNTES
uniref:Membrane associated guanylate kinase, WW and PDZ domain containing 2 n=1 Tax=Taenia asiatica TaxID=60517 RepID=A0A158R6Y3_TAEAS